MTQSRFFQVSLFLPVAVWGFALIIFSLVLSHDNTVIWQNLYNGHHIFVPYLIFAAVIWKLATNKPYGMLMFMAFIVPLLWGFFFTLWYVVVTYIQDGSIEDWFVLSIMVFWATFVGFLFEIIPFWVLSKFKTRFKAVEEQNNALSAQ
ncbi:MAG: hypothetical protein OEW04_04585 [Nitrospirota bacterium]|nr:hypothetical protein [Nitrospirota bacterium]